ncbi:MAG: LLM class flavin-dependent oxidoreductase [Polyangiaceae bacterium]
MKGRLAKYGREPEDLKVTPGLFDFLGSSQDEAEEKYQSFLSAVDLSGRHNMWGIDLSKHSLDDKLPDDLPEPENGRGRFRQAVALARRENLTIRELILRFSVVQGHRILVGTPKYVADQIEEWFVEKAADGFNLKPSTVPDSLDDFIKLVVPQLQKRRIFRTEYSGRTLRENLGLLRPANPHTGRAKSGIVASPSSEPAQAQL